MHVTCQPKTALYLAVKNQNRRGSTSAPSRFDGGEIFSVHFRVCGETSGWCAGSVRDIYEKRYRDRRFGCLQGRFPV